MKDCTYGPVMTSSVRSYLEVVMLGTLRSSCLALMSNTPCAGFTSQSVARTNAVSCTARHFLLMESSRRNCIATIYELHQVGLAIIWEGEYKLLVVNTRRNSRTRPHNGQN